MRRGYVPRSGVGIETGAWGELVIRDTYSCIHCQAIHEIDPSNRDPNAVQICRSCYGRICPRCANLPCEHWEAKLERFEHQHGLDHDRLLNMLGEAERAAARLA